MASDPSLFSNVADQRLSQIITHWSLIFRAHESKQSQKAAAQLTLVERYGGAIYYYLLSAVKDPDAVEELCQEFAYRLVRGDFKRADPKRGRFRDYVKASLFNLVADYRRQRQRQPLPLDSVAVDEASVEGPEEAFLQRWRDQLLARATEALAEFETRTAQPYHTILRLRTEKPQLTSAQLSEELAHHLRKPMTAAAARQTLHRAREKFAEFLFKEVARSIDATDYKQVEQELIDLRLLSFCKPALPRKSPR